MINVGIDMIEIERIEKSMCNRCFLSRILGEEEYLQLKKRGFPTRSVAGNFCAKEAFSKSVGTGIINFKFKEVQVIRDEKNKPFIKLTGEALRLYGAKDNEFCVSITHTKKLASAVVIFNKKGV